MFNLEVKSQQPILYNKMVATFVRITMIRRKEILHLLSFQPSRKIKAFIYTPIKIFMVPLKFYAFIVILNIPLSAIFGYTLKLQYKNNTYTSIFNFINNLLHRKAEY